MNLTRDWMKNKIFYIFFIIILVISSIITLFLYDYNQKLIKDIESKERLIKKTSSNDSILFETTKEYSKIISKYTFENEFMIGDKTSSGPQSNRMLPLPFWIFVQNARKFMHTNFTSELISI